MSNYYYNLRRKVNRRIATLNRRGLNSPALMSLLKSGFNTQYIKDLNLRKQQIAELEYFIGLKTSTYRGAKKYFEENSQLFDEINNLKKNDKSFFWDIYNELVSNNILYEKFKYNVLSDILLETSDITKSREEILQSIKDKYKNDIDFYETEFQPTITF